jgi:hypothetical protein
MESQCVPKSRAVRAVEGAVLGAVVGVVAGSLMGGLLFFSDRKNPRVALAVSLGIFGFAIVGQSIATAAPPEC